MIKEIQVKATVHKSRAGQEIQQEQLAHIKKELMRELKDFLRREHIRKYER